MLSLTLSSLTQCQHPVLDSIFPWIVQKHAHSVIIPLDVKCVSECVCMSCNLCTRPRVDSYSVKVNGCTGVFAL